MQLATIQGRLTLPKGRRKARRADLSKLTPEQKKERQRAAVRAWKLAHPDKLAGYRKNWNAANPEKARAIQRANYAKRIGKEPRPYSPRAPRKGRTATLTPEEATARARERGREWREKNAAEWRAKNRERIREQARRNQQKPEYKAKAKAYRERTKDIQRERHRKWREKQPDYKEKKRLYMVEYHASRHGTPAEIARNRRNGRNSYARIMADPVRHAEKLAKLRAAYERMKADPVRYARFMERQRAEREKYRARLRADPAKLAAFHEANRRRNAKAKPAPKVRAAPREQLAYPYRTAERSPMLASVYKLIPKGIHPEVRADLCQDLIADICAQVVTLEQLADPKKLRPYITRANQLLGRYGQVSLDEVIPGTDSLRLIDTIDSETSIYEATAYK